MKKADKEPAPPGEDAHILCETYKLRTQTQAEADKIITSNDKALFQIPPCRAFELCECEPQKSAISNTDP